MCSAARQRKEVRLKAPERWGVVVREAAQPLSMAVATLALDSSPERISSTAVVPSYPRGTRTVAGSPPPKRHQRWWKMLGRIAMKGGRAQKPWAEGDSFELAPPPMRRWRTAETDFSAASHDANSRKDRAAELFEPPALLPPAVAVAGADDEVPTVVPTIALATIGPQEKRALALLDIGLRGASAMDSVGAGTLMMHVVLFVYVSPEEAEEESLTGTAGKSEDCRDSARVPCRTRTIAFVRNA